ncbi:MAG: hypothetical protein U5K30_02795 [Acidimicrobiales bacterium]|nr:hypothetical protein [Acidimicrobiales bacterium]
MIEHSRPDIPPTARRSPWWRATTELDPWAGHDDDPVPLTADQEHRLRTFDDQPRPPHLIGLVNGADQPAVPRLVDAPDHAEAEPRDGTGNPPGDTEQTSSYGPGKEEI